jgi:hypothetical protein
MIKMIKKCGLKILSIKNKYQPGWDEKQGGWVYAKHETTYAV